MSVPQIVPEKYTLSVEKGFIKLFLHFSGGRKSGIEVIPFNNGKSLPGVRKRGQKLAKYNQVPFVDFTEKNS